LEITAAKALAQALVCMGTEWVYGIVGTSNIAFLDALYEIRDKIRYISCRHEQVAASMADAQGRLTGKPGVALVHSGPGALNAAISVGNAYKDCSPMILITGAVKRKLAGSDGMLEINHLKIFEPLCKGVYRIEKASGILEIFQTAYIESLISPRGPVLIEVPEDVWLEKAKLNPDKLSLEVPLTEPINKNEVQNVLNILKDSNLPLILSGGGVAYSGASGKLVEFAEKLKVPVITTGNGRGTIPERHPLCLGRVGFGGGTPVADSAFQKADALLRIGCYLSDMTTYEFTLRTEAKEIIAVNTSERIAPQAQSPTKFIKGDAYEFLDTSLGILKAENASKEYEWDKVLEKEKSDWEKMKELCLKRESDLPSAGKVANVLGQRLASDAIICVGAGTHLLYPMAYIPSEKPLCFLSTVNFGSMGFGFAASMAAKLIHPERQVITIIGDGDFMMTVQDLETAVRERIPVKVFVFNDFRYRVLTLRQMLQFEGRIYGTVHGNPDFASIACSFGARGYKLDDQAKIEETIENALAEKEPVVVDVLIDPNDLPPMNIEANLRMSAG